MPGARPRVPRGFSVRRGLIAPGEIVTVGGVRCTSPLRTAYDLGRRVDPVEAVVAVDRLSNVHRFNPDLLLHFTARYRGARSTDGLIRALVDACPYACSPMETRLRLLLVDAGLPPPRVQWVVQDPVARTAVWLDLAYPRHRVGIEYDGREHADPDRVLLDIGRSTRLVDKGWRIYRYTKREIRSERDRIVDEVRRAVEGDTIGISSAPDPHDVYLGHW